MGAIELEEWGWEMNGNRSGGGKEREQEQKNTRERKRGWTVGKENDTDKHGHHK